MSINSFDDLLKHNYQQQPDTCLDHLKQLTADSKKSTGSSSSPKPDISDREAMIFFEREVSAMTQKSSLTADQLTQISDKLELLKTKLSQRRQENAETAKPGIGLLYHTLFKGAQAKLQFRAIDSELLRARKMRLNELSVENTVNYPEMAKLLTDMLPHLSKHERTKELSLFVKEKTDFLNDLMKAETPEKQKALTVISQHLFSCGLLYDAVSNLNHELTPVASEKIGEGISNAMKESIEKPRIELKTAYKKLAGMDTTLTIPGQQKETHQNQDRRSALQKIVIDRALETIEQRLGHSGVSERERQLVTTLRQTEIQHQIATHGTSDVRIDIPKSCKKGKSELTLHASTSSLRGKIIENAQELERILQIVSEANCPLPGDLAQFRNFTTHSLSTIFNEANTKTLAYVQDMLAGWPRDKAALEKRLLQEPYNRLVKAYKSRPASSTDRDSQQKIQLERLLLANPTAENYEKLLHACKELREADPALKTWALPGDKIALDAETAALLEKLTVLQYYAYESKQVIGNAAREFLNNRTVTSQSEFNEKVKLLSLDTARSLNEQHPGFLEYYAKVTPPPTPSRRPLRTTPAPSTQDASSVTQASITLSDDQIKLLRSLETLKTKLDVHLRNIADLASRTLQENTAQSFENFKLEFVSNLDRMLPPMRENFFRGNREAEALYKQLKPAE